MKPLTMKQCPKCGGAPALKWREFNVDETDDDDNVISWEMRYWREISCTRCGNYVISEYTTDAEETKVEDGAITKKLVEEWDSYEIYLGK